MLEFDKEGTIKVDGIPAPGDQIMTPEVVERIAKAGTPMSVVATSDALLNLPFKDIRYFGVSGHSTHCISIILVRKSTTSDMDTFYSVNCSVILL